MAILNPPLTDNKTLNSTLLSLIKEINRIDRKHSNLINDIVNATNFADLQAKVSSRQ